MSQTRGFQGSHVICFENRRAGAMEKLIQKHGGIPWVVPAMREVPLSENPEAFRFAEKLFAGEIDIFILMTGVGSRVLIEILKTKYDLEIIKTHLKKVMLIARGPKPVAALGEIKLAPNLTIPEPNTWHEILTTLDQKHPVRSKQIAIQEYGISNHQLITELEKRGAYVLRVPVYRWAFPENTEPIKEAVKAVASSTVKIVLWTNAQQIVHVLQIARELGSEKIFLEAIANCFIGSIGPTCSEALLRNGIHVDFEPSHPKMATLVSEAAEKVHDS